MLTKHPLVLALAAALMAGAILVGMYTAQHEFDEPTVAPPQLEPTRLLPDWRHEDLPDFSQYTVISELKEAFFDFLFPRIALANHQILRLRDYAEELSGLETLTERQLDWLETQSERLRVPGEPGTEAHFDALIKRLDIIPPSLMLAQAANESAWGTSRFALQGNNLFGQWCFVEGCGLVPSRRAEGMNHEVAVYDSPYASIRSYITNLNRHNAYNDLRLVRSQQRAEDELPDGHTLAGGLASYSERGMAYVTEIRSMINFNNLSEYDERLEALVDSEDIHEELDELVRSYRQRFSQNDSPPE